MRQDIVVITDDIDGSDNASTHTFALDGCHYEIDLSAGNFAALAEALDPYITAGRLDRSRVQGVARPLPAAPNINGSNGYRASVVARTQLADAIDTKHVRDWWRRNPAGLPQWRANGALPVSVKEAWLARNA